MHAISETKRWLESVPWEDVVEQNRKLCEESKVRPELNHDRTAHVHKLWETTAARELSLLQVLDTVRQCIKEEPFRFNNVNSFAAVAGRLVESLAKSLPPVEAQILISTVCRYVEGNIRKGELQQVFGFFANRVKPSLQESSASPAPSPVQAQPQTT